MGYQIDIDILKCRESPEVLWQELTKTMAGGQKALNHLLGRRVGLLRVRRHRDRPPAPLPLARLRGPEPPVPPERFLDFYRHIDRLIGKIVAAYHKLTNTYAGFYILSDHGFTGIVQEVYLNAWLEQNGYLRFLKPEPTGLGDIHGRTRAFALDPNRIYINLKNRFPKGSVERAARRALRQEIAGKLGTLDIRGPQGRPQGLLRRGRLLTARTPPRAPTSSSSASPAST
ncbi:MAG: alkaline phosphatase family protein [Candidatus Moduliflexus flocculans]|nr:alkaline phosphatase family protein [Candidatus Moduliflexus flocculans]